MRTQRIRPLLCGRYNRQGVQVGEVKLGVCVWCVTVHRASGSERKGAGARGRWMKGRNACLCSTKSALLFFDLRRLQSAKVCFLFPAELPLLPYHTSHLWGSRQTDSGAGVEGPARRRFDKLDFCGDWCRINSWNKRQDGRGAGRKKEGKVGWDDEEVRGRGETFGKTQKGNSKTEEELGA